MFYPPEAPTGVEPALADLKSAARPMSHGAYHTLPHSPLPSQTVPSLHRLASLNRTLPCLLCSTGPCRAYPRLACFASLIHASPNPTPPCLLCFTPPNPTPPHRALPRLLCLTRLHRASPGYAEPRLLRSAGPHQTTPALLCLTAPCSTSPRHAEPALLYLARPNHTRPYRARPRLLCLTTPDRATPDRTAPSLQTEQHLTLSIRAVGTASSPQRGATRARQPRTSPNPARTTPCCRDDLHPSRSASRPAPSGSARPTR